jgi:hypothetical protein
MNTPSEPPVYNEPGPNGMPSRVRIRIGVVLAFAGLLIFLVGARPGLFGLDRSPVVGFVQIEVFLVGLIVICLGGYIGLTALWKNGNRTIPADIGTRLLTTGLVVAVFSGMADVFGFGTQLRPRIPLFGPWQATGVQVGEVLIAIGFLFLIPFRMPRKR